MLKMQKTRNLPEDLALDTSMPKGSTKRRTKVKNQKKKSKETNGDKLCRSTEEKYVAVNYYRIPLRTSRLELEM